MECRPPSASNHKYIIVAVEYFTKWAEAIPTFNNTAATAALFFFNHVIARFGVPKKLVSDHGQHFEDDIWHELSSLLGFEHQYSSSYYPQGNGQVEAVNKILKTMLQQTVNKHKKIGILCSSLLCGPIELLLKLPSVSLLSTLFSAKRQSYRSSVKFLPFT